VVLGGFTGVSTPLVRATVIHRKGREITIEFQARGELVWEPETFDVLLVDGGGELGGTVDLSRTTRAGKLAPGRIGRITIVLDADSDARVHQIVFARVAFAVV
jgi:hypothetical protein